MVVVDDQPLVRMGLRTLIGSEDDLELVGEAEDGREAVELAAGREYQAIFMDCLMPEMDGYAATAEIRRREPDGRHVPIIALTASALPEDRARCLDAGMDAHIAKPLLPADVAHILERWTSRLPVPDMDTVVAEVEHSSAGVDDGERDWWRVEAGAGAAAGTGVYDLCFDWSRGSWSLARVLD